MAVKKRLSVGEILANVKGHRLDYHQAAVCFFLFKLLKRLSPREDYHPQGSIFGASPATSLLVACAEAALCHDVGKCCRAFQKYINHLMGLAAKKKDTIGEISDLLDPESLTVKRFKGPYHQEISFVLLATSDTPAKDRKYLASGHLSSNQDIKPSDLSVYGVYWHHEARVENNGGQMERNTIAKIKEAACIGDRNDFDHLVQDGSMITKASASCFLQILDKITKTDQQQDFIVKAFRDVACGLSEGGLRGFDYANWDLPIPSYQDGGEDGRWKASRGGMKKLALHLLIEADRKASSLSNEQLVDLCENGIDPDLVWPNDDNTGTPWQEGVAAKTENMEKGNRERLQMQAAKKMANSGKPIAVLEGDPGAGKTAISLMSSVFLYEASSRKVRRNLVLALPEQGQVTNVFTTITERDLARLTGTPEVAGKEITVEGVFGGSRQHDSHPENSRPLVSSDVSILTFDRLLSTHYERKQHREFMHTLFADVVLDESQDLLKIPKMVIATAEFIFMRKLLRGAGRVIVTTATLFPALLEELGLGKIDNYSFLMDGEDVVKISRGELAEVHKDGIIFIAVPGGFKNGALKTPIGAASFLSNLRLYIEETLKTHGLKAPADLLRDTMLSFNLIEEAIYAGIPKVIDDWAGPEKTTSMIVHSNLPARHKKELITGALREFGGHGDAAGTVFSASLLAASYELNFLNGIRVTGLPCVDAQTIGRIMRLIGKVGGLFVHVVEDYNLASSIFSEKLAGFLDLHRGWDRWLLKNLTIPKIMTKREYFTEIYDSFIFSKEAVKAGISGLRGKLGKEGAYYQVAKDLSKWYPVKFQSTKAKPKSTNGLANSQSAKESKGDKGFRGTSKLATAAVFSVTDQNGQPTASGYLRGKDLLSLSDTRLVEALTNATRPKSKARKDLMGDSCSALIKDSNFDINAYRAFGYDESSPFFLSAIKQSDSSLHRGYESALGGLSEVYLTGIGVMSEEAAKYIIGQFRQSLSYADSCAYETGVLGIKKKATSDDGEE